MWVWWVGGWLLSRSVGPWVRGEEGGGGGVRGLGGAVRQVRYNMCKGKEHQEPNEQ